jgi:hypothetical protein
MKDLLFFVCFILIFFFGFSVSSWSLLMTSTQIDWIYSSDGALMNITIADDASHTWSWRLLHDVTNYGIWKVFGQVDPIGKEKHDARAMEGRQWLAVVEMKNHYSAVAFVLAIFFVAISNVLLLNVLIALFK